MTLFELAPALETAEAQHLALQIEHYQQLYSDPAAHWLHLAGGVAAASRGDWQRKLNHVCGLGTGSVVTPADLQQIEALYLPRGMAVEIDVCPYADASLLPLLAARGYQADAFSNTYVRELSAADTAAPALNHIEVHPITPDQDALFLQTAVAGFAVQAQPRSADLLVALARIALQRADTVNCIAWINGEPAGSASLALMPTPLGDVAYLYMASTVPNFRGRGVQQAIFKARLAIALEQGARWASTSIRPGNVSARNAERMGFALAYTKCTCVLRPPRV